MLVHLRSALRVTAMVLLLFGAAGGQNRDNASSDPTYPSGAAKQSAQPRPSLVLMGLAAHPDDEDGATLAYYRKLQNIDTYSIFFTRGEGGQNETGSELGEELGRLRTRETLDAGAILGVKVGFLGFPDFGYSKTARETFERWGGKDSVLARLVAVIRAVRPDVIITNHDTATNGRARQHGNHQAAGIAAYEAFFKAADPSYHPEQLHNGVTPWQVKKLFVRYRPSVHPPAESLVTVNIQAHIKTALTVEDVAMEALARHRSQGVGRMPADSLPPEWRQRMYRLYAADRLYDYDESDLFAFLRASAREVGLPAGVLPDTAGSGFTMTVSPAYSSFAADTNARNTTRRTCLLQLRNATGKPLRVEVLGSYDRTRIFQKAYTFPDGMHRLIADTVELAIDHGRIDDPKRFLFIASPAERRRKQGLGRRKMSVLPPVRAEVVIKPMPGKAAPAGPVGLVRTYDRTLEETMQSLGVPYELLDSAMLASGDLARFGTILLDMRFGQYRPDAVRAMPRILDYASGGGHVVSFYQKPDDWNGKMLSPYPITITGDRVTEEDAPVTELLPGHPLLTVPNLITPADWNGWVQERSIYLPAGDTARTAVNYQRLLAMSDTDETQPPTSLLWAKTGSGSYTYVSLALYRQLRMLHDGAVKLFLNLVSQSRP